ncbi:MAG: hypothetical protein A2068_07890 [Ignavibacteria bacterium GWB2_35_6b]|nr:MAG: hypothetical protein A2068_07890 [Ignavibacteria bacterium GWB2_35_6b]
MTKTFASEGEKVIQYEVVVNAEVSEVYETWTTPEGIKTFFAPECEVELKLFGSYHIYFNPQNPVGTKGAEDEMIISFQKNKMLSFTWGFPPVLPDLRDNQKTIVTLRFEDLGNNKTKIVFTQSGWGEGEDWDKGYGYFEKAWKDIVFKNLVDRFENGPIDWNSLSE